MASRKFPDAPPKTKLPKAAARKSKPKAPKGRAAAAFVASDTDSKRRRLHPEDAPAERVNFMLPADLNKRMRLHLGALPKGERMSASYLVSDALRIYLDAHE